MWAPWSRHAIAACGRGVTKLKKIPILVCQTIPSFIQENVLMPWRKPASLSCKRHQRIQ
ncbi:hypothetical protein KPSA1_02573 [Pseudomonas syringae pv. actinidiae]|uniref:Uncharacterized protein n=1 Tax=Pseudomonas syringae pv. actinidiae TaxID=103796 RepID=A0A2V0QV64_PSESF|nr:hypothetical protein KPSA1_02573 [Pseudomonas syringae pv. actinidiae]GBH16899.1 hypothetical protein KPSA3_02857 [Pseudomonas syringae pv. actinidiae]